jgi:hypothetical protein
MTVRTTILVVAVATVAVAGVLLWPTSARDARAVPSVNLPSAEGPTPVPRAAAPLANRPMLPTPDPEPSADQRTQVPMGSASTESTVAAEPAPPLSEALPAEGSTADIDPVNLPAYDAIRGYIRDVFRPRFRDCWATILGDGMIQVRHDFLIEDGIARAASRSDNPEDIVTLMESTLSPEDDLRALHCLRQAAEGTSFKFVPLTPDGETTGTHLSHHKQYETMERYRRRTGQGTP